MSESLREQLLRAGLKPQPGAKRKPSRVQRKPAAAQGKHQNQGEMDLAQAYAARRRTEEREKVEQKQAKARREAARKQQNDALAVLLAGCALNDPQADIPRHFMDRKRITRIYVTDRQRQQLAAGEIGIVKLRGRYLLVDSSRFDAITGIKPDALVDLSQEAEAAQ